MLEHLHFLRPLWLLALVPVAALYVMVRYVKDETRAWRKIIDPALLAHLRVPATGRTFFRPVHLVTLAGALCAIAAAGPTWQREVSPFAEDVAPLVIALDLSPSMNATDIQPTRLERAKHKVQEILDGRHGARTALVAYAGSAHVVLPLCDDPSIFAAFLSALESDIMPTDGRDVVAAMAVSEQLLARSDVPGTIVFITDGVGGAADQLAQSIQQSQHSVAILAVGTSRGGAVRNSDGSFVTDAAGRRIVARLEREQLEKLHREAGVSVVGVTADRADVAQVERRIESNLRAAQQDDLTMRWKDMGYYGVFPIVALVLFWFRRGWVVQWGSLLFAVFLTGCSDETASWSDLWWTADQQGRQLFERQRYAEAADSFADPMWKGTAAYRAGDFARAIEEFSRVDTPESYFNQGNALAHLGSFDAAVAAYDAALSSRPQWPEARANRDLVVSLIPAEPDDEEESELGGDPTFDPDQIEFSEKGKKGKRGEVQQSAFSEEQITEMWMRRLQTSPGAYLRTRFAIEVAEHEAQDGEAQ